MIAPLRAALRAKLLELEAEMRGLATAEWGYAEWEGSDPEGSQIQAQKHQATADTSKYWADKIAALLSPEDRDKELLEQRMIGHGEGQEHTIADVNAGRIDDLIAPRLRQERLSQSYEKRPSLLSPEGCEALRDRLLTAAERRAEDGNDDTIVELLRDAAAALPSPPGADAPQEARELPTPQCAFCKGTGAGVLSDDMTVAVCFTCLDVMSYNSPRGPQEAAPPAPQRET